jgi:hypothetical protein
MPENYFLSGSVVNLAELLEDVRVKVVVFSVATTALLLLGFARKGQAELVLQLELINSVSRRVILLCCNDERVFRVKATPGVLSTSCAEPACKLITGLAVDRVG